MTIAVLGGGSSTEREVSLRSAASVSTALQSAGYRVVNYDPVRGFQGLLVLAFDMVFPILHGEGGEDGSVQRKLEALGIPFLGTGSQASAGCFDKSVTRAVLGAKGVPVARGYRVSREEYDQNHLKKSPHVLKVSKGGSSIGTYIVRNPAEINAEEIEQVFLLDKYAVIEELVLGTEITVPILDKTPLSPVEIVPPEGRDFDYENKYNGKSTELCPPVSIDKRLISRAKELALQTHVAMQARHLSRTDIIVRPDGSMVVLEINTIPGMTDQSLFPLSAAYDGINMSELVDRFVKMVARDYKIKLEDI